MLRPHVSVCSCSKTRSIIHTHTPYPQQLLWCDACDMSMTPAMSKKMAPPHPCISWAGLSRTFSAIVSNHYGHDSEILDPNDVFYLLQFVDF